MIKLHMIFVVKYRKPLLVNSLGEDIKQIMFDISKKEDSQFSIDTMEVDKDHLHMLLDIEPITSAASVCSCLKQMSTHRIWEIYPETLKKSFLEKSRHFGVMDILFYWGCVYGND